MFYSVKNIIFGLPAGSNNIGSVTSFQNGTTGLDYSSNKPTLPNTYQNFSNSGPYSNYVFITSVSANTSRNNIDIENNSGSQIVIIRDDGTSANNTTLNNSSVFTLAGGSGIGSQGGSWFSSTFKGRIQIYASSNTAQVAVMTE
jgi:hypothetical protein